MDAKRDQTAGRQLGLITLRQLRDLGLTVRQVHREVVAGDLIPMRVRVYRQRGAPISWEQSVLSAVLSAGDGFVASRTTAAAVFNLRHSERFNAGIHITGDRRVRIQGVTSHLIRLGTEEWTTSSGIPITTPERTIIDIAGTLTAVQLGQCVDDAIRRRLVHLERLRTLVAAAPSHGGQRSLKPLHDILAERIRGYRPDDSEFETAMNRTWEALELPAARRQYRVTVGGHSYRLDRAIVECKIAVEWDSERHHTAPSDRTSDSNRRARLAAAGWLVIPVTGHSEPKLIADAVLRAYHDRGGNQASRAVG